MNCGPGQQAAEDEQQRGPCWASSRSGRRGRSRRRRSCGSVVGRGWCSCGDPSHRWRCGTCSRATTSPRSACTSVRPTASGTTSQTRLVTPRWAHWCSTGGVVEQLALGEVEVDPALHVAEPLLASPTAARSAAAARTSRRSRRRSPPAELRISTPSMKPMSSPSTLASMICQNVGRTSCPRPGRSRRSRCRRRCRGRRRRRRRGIDTTPTSTETTALARDHPAAGAGPG